MTTTTATAYTFGLTDPQAFSLYYGTGAAAAIMIALPYSPALSTLTNLPPPLFFGILTAAAFYIGNVAVNNTVS